MKNDYLIVSIDKIKYAIHSKCVDNILELSPDIYAEQFRLNKEASVRLLGRKIPVLEFSRSLSKTTLNENVALIIICLKDFKYAIRIDSELNNNKCQLAKKKSMAFEFKKYVFDVDSMAIRYDEQALEELYSNYQLFDRIAI